MLCTPLVWMRIAAVATLYNPSGYVIGMMQCSIQNLDFAATAVYKILYQAVNAGSAVYKIFNQSVDTGSAVYKIVYPDIVYEVATAAIFIQTRGVQSGQGTFASRTFASPGFFASRSFYLPKIKYLFAS